MKIFELVEELESFNNQDMDVSLLLIGDDNINVDIDEVKKDNDNGEAYLCVNLD